MGLNATAGTLLGFLHDGPRTGWGIWSEIEVSVGNFWNVTRSQVYRELGRLAEDGLVKALPAGPRDRQPFRITAKGRAAFRRWLADGPAPETRRIPILLSTFFAAHLPAATFAAMLDEQEHEAAATLARFEALEVIPMDPFQAATLQFGLGYAQLVQRWINDVARPLVEEHHGADRAP
ncbi:helix-turn-helix transcriptional regulator [soil metagenome]